MNTLVGEHFVEESLGPCEAQEAEIPAPPAKPTLIELTLDGLKKVEQSFRDQFMQKSEADF